MSRLKTGILFVLLVAVLVITLLPLRGVAGNSGYTKKYTNPDTGYYAYIDDREGFFDWSSIDRVMEAMKVLTTEGNVILVTDSPFGEDMESYADRYFMDRNGPVTPGIILMINWNGTSKILKAYNGLEEKISDQKAKSIVNDVYDYPGIRGNATYATLIFDRCDKELTELRIGRKFKNTIGIFFSIIIAFLLGGVILDVMMFSSKPSRKKKLKSMSSSKSINDRTVIVTERFEKYSPHNNYS
ncbi:Uncharacterized membrane protein YgcG, contains a TPM-fold domain [Lachnospiraceae bacterium XPB1003]|nr:Uncharacterized membrane protein YgcG, contains a TPM-fold domain [Lachnospiraceae bacterium XPB1003]